MVRKKKYNLLMILFMLFACLGIGYAYLTTNLTINGANGIEGNYWDVHWDNIQVTTGSVTGDQITTAPTISNDGTTVTYHIRLREPGEFYEFTIDVVNAGTVDAMIDTITKKVNNTTNIPEYLRYTIKYIEGYEIGEHQLLSANSSETYVVRVEYRTDIDPSVLPTTQQSLSLTFGISYIQSDSFASEKDYVYSTYTLAGIAWGSELPTVSTYYSSAKAAMDSWDFDYFVRNKIENGLVSYSEIGFVINGKIYYITSGNGATYASNITKLNGIFGENRCHTGINGPYATYTCSIGSFKVSIEDRGVVNVYKMGNETFTACPCFIAVNSLGGKYSGCYSD